MTAGIFIIVLIYVIKAIIRNLRFNPKEVSLKNGWVRSCFYDEAHYLVQRKFNMYGKPVYTQKGEYRANYMVERRALKIMHFEDLSNGFIPHLHLLKVNYPMKILIPRLSAMRG